MSIGVEKLTTILADIHVTMSTLMDNQKTFSEWLVGKMSERGISQSDLARLSGISRQAISNYINQQRSRPDNQALRNIAQGLRISEEEIFRAAGVLRELDPDYSPSLAEWMDLFNTADEDTREEMLDLARAVLEVKQRKNRQAHA